MRQYKKALDILLVGACVMLCAPVLAQTEDIAVFDSSENDFLLPSYFDTPAQTYAPQTAILPQDNRQMVSSPHIPTDIDILNEIFGSQKPASVIAAQNAAADKKNAAKLQAEQKDQKKTGAPILTPLDPIPPAPEPMLEVPKRTQHKSLYAAKLLAKETGKNKAAVQIPKDMRLLFEPNSARLAESVVKWLTAYSLHVQKDPSLVLNIRISNQNWDLQQMRLGMVVKLLIEKGLSSKQIRVFQSNRDPDTMIIGTDTDPNQTKIIVPAETKRVVREQKTFAW